MIKAVLFDLDGVLVDAVRLHQQAFIQAIAPYRYITEEEHMRDLNALPTRKKLEKLNMEERLAEEIYEKKQQLTVKLIPKFIQPIPAVTKTIEELKRQQIPFAVCSNSIRASTELLLRYGGIEGHSFFISNQDISQPKPNPEMYLKAIEMLQLKPEEVLIVEDSPVGLEAAYASKAKVCKVNNPFELNTVLEVIKKENEKV